MPDFSGKVALVTGAGRGIGRSIALGLAAGGAHVALLARSTAELDEVAAAVRDAGGRALVVPADVSDPAAIDAAAERVQAEAGTVDILINNAGVVWPLAETAKVDPAEWAAAININLVGPAHFTIAVLPGMLGQGWGRIINVSSGVVTRPGGMIGANAYHTSKSALEAHTLALAAELEGTGVTANAYRPGGVDTAMQGWIRSQPVEQVGAVLHDRFVDNYEKGTLLTPDQSAAPLVARILSDATGGLWSVRD